MNKYEQLIEHIISDEESKARALFHQIVVERSREIYESLMDEEPGMHNGGVNDLVDEVSRDEHGMHEEDEEVGMPGDDMSGDPAADDISSDDPEMGAMDGMDGGMGGDDSPATKSDILDLESAIDELKAEFERLVSHEDGESGDEEGEEETGDEEGSENPFGGADDEESDDEESADDEEAEEEEDAVAESRTRDRSKMSDAERLREYVDKVGHDWDKNAQKGPKGESVGTGNKSESQGEKNTTSLTSGKMKNDMGGTTGNILKGGAEQSPDGKEYKAPSNQYAKGRGDLPHANNFENVPGANAGKSAFKTREPGHGAEKAGAGEGKLVGADGSRPINKDSIIKGKVR